MSPDLTAIRALLASVEGFTPGPWEWVDVVDGIDSAIALRGPSRFVLDLGIDPHEQGYGGRSGEQASERDDALIAAAPTLHAHLTDLVGEVERLRTRVRHADNVLAAIDGIRAFGEDPADCAARLVSNLLEIKSACHGRPGEHPIAAFRRALAAGEVDDG